MIPAEFLIVSAMTVGITVPIATVIEASHPPADMTRYEMRRDCVEGKTIIDVCLFDTGKNEVVGGKP